jgi:hypothetical protein
MFYAQPPTLRFQFYNNTRNLGRDHFYFFFRDPSYRYRNYTHKFDKTLKMSVEPAHLRSNLL